MNQEWAEVKKLALEKFTRAVANAKGYRISTEEMLRIVCHEEMSDLSDLLNGDSKIKEYCILKLSRGRI